MAAQYDGLLDLSYEGEIVSDEYLVEHRIEKGRFCWNYQALHVEHQEAVTLKALIARHAREPGFRNHFLQIIKEQIRLKHPNIIRVHKYFEHDGLPCVITEWNDGSELSDWLELNETGISLESISSFVFPICRALNEAHRLGVLHLDLNPSNVLLSLAGGEVTPKVTRFGLSRLLFPSDLMQGKGTETLLFRAPEYLNSSGNFDKRADVYSFGILLYRLVSGALPFTGEGHEAIAHIQYKPVQKPERCSERLFQLISRCIDRDPAARYSSFSEILDELASVLPPETALEALNQGAETGSCLELAIDNDIAEERLVHSGSFAEMPASSEAERLAFESYSEILAVEPSSFWFRWKRWFFFLLLLLVGTLGGVELFLYPTAPKGGKEKQGKKTVLLQKKASVSKKVDLLNGIRPRYALNLKPGAISQVLGVPNARVAWIPPGRFLMGSPAVEVGRELIEGPETNVHLSKGFWMWQTEVTQKQFESLMMYNPSRAKGCGERCPVETVSGYEAAAFCNILSKLHKVPTCYRCFMSGLNLVCNLRAKYWSEKGKAYYSCPGWRLPTEAEWEYAYRAGKSRSFFPLARSKKKVFDPRANLSNYGYLADLRGWYRDNSGSRTHSVGLKFPNFWGLYDMAGNVWEWTFDAYSRYPGGNVDDPIQIVGPRRILRGGGVNSEPKRLRASERKSMKPNRKGYDLGFRIVRTGSPKP